MLNDYQRMWVKDRNRIDIIQRNDIEYLILAKQTKEMFLHRNKKKNYLTKLEDIHDCRSYLPI